MISAVIADVCKRRQISTREAAGVNEKTKENYYRNNCTVSDFAAASIMTNENFFKSKLIGSHILQLPYIIYFKPHIIDSI